MGTSWKKARIYDGSGLADIFTWRWAWSRLTGPTGAGAAVEIFLAIMFLPTRMVEDRRRDLAANIIEMVLWFVDIVCGISGELVL